MRYRSWSAAVCAVLLALCALPAVPARAKQPAYTPAQRAVLETYARDTWKSFVALVDPKTGLPADNVDANGKRSGYTSPTNIGAYIWSTIAARDIGVISQKEALTRMLKTVGTLRRMERSDGGAAPRCAGQFYNWYDPANGKKLTAWPVDNGKLYPFLSSVDNGWLAAGLMMLANGVPQLRVPAGALAGGFDFGCFYDPVVGQIRGGYWDGEPQPNSWTPQISDPVCNVRDADDPKTGGFTCFHYGTHNTEPRIASYIGIAMGDIPPEHYFRTFRTFPGDTCAYSWSEQKAVGAYRMYEGVSVFEGAYEYRGKRIVPSWGGSMFEALMVPLLVPEEDWGPRSWGVNHPLYVEAQIEHGLQEAKYGYWGFSPSNNPAGGYREYGVDAIGMNPDGYASDQERTMVDGGYGECRAGLPIPTSYGAGVVTPHASFLALEYAPKAALDNLAKLRRNFKASYGWGGFYDAVDVKSGTVSQFYLALDNGMIMAALGNALSDDRLQGYFTRGPVEAKLKPLLGLEEFNAGRSAPRQ